MAVTCQQKNKRTILVTNQLVITKQYSAKEVITVYAYQSWTWVHFC